MRDYSQAGNISPANLIREAKTDLGLINIPIPFDEEFFLDILYLKTMPTFNKFYPRKVKELIRSFDLKNAYDPEGLNRYVHIDTNKYNIREVTDVYYKSPPETMAYDPLSVGVGDAYDMMVSAINACIIDDMISDKIIFRWDEPNTLFMKLPYMLNNDDLIVELFVDHSLDLSSIGKNYKDKLSSLYQTDLKISMYPTLKQLTPIETTFGTIELNLDNWDNAPSDRKEIESDWNETYLSHNRKIVFR